MAQSRNGNTMARLERLERDVGDIKAAILQIVPLLVSHDERLEKLDSRFEQLDARFGNLEGGFVAVTDRLDRLIAVTIQDRTAWADRILQLERRLARVEERVGI